MKIQDVMTGATPDAQAEAMDMAPGMTQATPEEQAEYDKVVLAGTKIIYDDTTREQVLQSVAASEDPAQGMGLTAATIITTLDERMRGMIPESVILPAAAEILEQLAELVDAAKAAKVDQALMGRAAQFMLMKLSDSYDFDPADVQEVIDSVPESAMEKIVAEQDGYARSAPPPMEMQEQQGPEPEEYDGSDIDLTNLDDAAQE